MRIFYVFAQGLILIICWKLWNKTIRHLPFCYSDALQFHVFVSYDLYLYFSRNCQMITLYQLKIHTKSGLLIVSSLKRGLLWIPVHLVHSYINIVCLAYLQAVSVLIAPFPNHSYSLTNHSSQYLSSVASRMHFCGFPWYFNVWQKIKNHWAPHGADRVCTYPQKPFKTLEFRNFEYCPFSDITPCKLLKR